MTFYYILKTLSKSAALLKSVFNVKKFFAMDSHLICVLPNILSVLQEQTPLQTVIHQNDFDDKLLVFYYSVFPLSQSHPVMKNSTFLARNF